MDTKPASQHTPNTEAAFARCCEIAADCESGTGPGNYTGVTAKKDAEAIRLILRSHAALVEALEALVERGTDSPEHRAAEAALRLAKGE